MSIENAKHYLAHARSQHDIGTQWAQAIQRCLSAIIDTLEMRDNRTSAPAPTVTPEQVVGALQDTDVLPCSSSQDMLAAAVRELSWALMYCSRVRHIASDIDRYRTILDIAGEVYDYAVQEMQDE